MGIVYLSTQAARDRQPIKRRYTGFVEETTLPDRNVNQYVPKHLSVVLAGKTEANLLPFFPFPTPSSEFAETGQKIQHMSHKQERGDNLQSHKVNTCNEVALQFRESYCNALRSRN